MTLKTLNRLFQFKLFLPSLEGQMQANVPGVRTISSIPWSHPYGSKPQGLQPGSEKKNFYAIRTRDFETVCLKNQSKLEILMLALKGRRLVRLEGFTDLLHSWKDHSIIFRLMDAKGDFGTRSVHLFELQGSRLGTWMLFLAFNLGTLPAGHHLLRQVGSVSLSLWSVYFGSLCPITKAPCCSI